MSEATTITREQIFQLLADAGATRTHSCCGIDSKLCGTDEWRGNMEAVVKMAYAAGQQAEREACEKACESIEDEYMRNESGKWPEMKSDAQTGAADCVAAIRERRTSAKPSEPMVQWVKDQAEKRKRVAAEHVSRGECPECDGSGEIGGQFSGGDLPCPSCAGTGRLSQGNERAKE